MPVYRSPLSLPTYTSHAIKAPLLTFDVMACLDFITAPIPTTILIFLALTTIFEHGGRVFEDVLLQRTQENTNRKEENYLRAELKLYFSCCIDLCSVHLFVLFCFNFLKNMFFKCRYSMC